MDFSGQKNVEIFETMNSLSNTLTRFKILNCVTNRGLPPPLPEWPVIAIKRWVRSPPPHPKKSRHESGQIILSI